MNFFYQGMQIKRNAFLRKKISGTKKILPPASPSSRKWDWWTNPLTVKEAFDRILRLNKGNHSMAIRDLNVLAEEMKRSSWPKEVRLNLSPTKETRELLKKLQPPKPTIKELGVFYKKFRFSPSQIFENEVGRWHDLINEEISKDPLLYDHRQAPGLILSAALSSTEKILSPQIQH